MSSFSTCLWPLKQIGAAMELLARRSGLLGEKKPSPALKYWMNDDHQASINTWIETAAGWLEIEAEPESLNHGDLQTNLKKMGPSILQIPGSEPQFVMILKGGRKGVTLLKPDQSVEKFPASQLMEAVLQDLAQNRQPALDKVIPQLSPEKQSRLKLQLILNQIESYPFQGLWVLRGGPRTSGAQRARQARLHYFLSLYLILNLVMVGLVVASWWALGRGALRSDLNSGLLTLWVVLLLAIVPLQVAISWSQEHLITGAGKLLKQWLMMGSLALDPSEIRQHGVGQLLGRVMESEAVESLALSGGLTGAVAIIEVIVAGLILQQGAGAAWHLPVLLLCLALTLYLGWFLHGRRSRWTHERLELTDDLVEKMVGHRTRLVQQPADDWHVGEQPMVDHYKQLSKEHDWSKGFVGSVPRIWLIVAFAGLASAIESGADLTALAISAGGILLAFGGLVKMSQGLDHLSGAMIAWKNVAPFFNAARRKEELGDPDYSMQLLSNPPSAKMPLLEGKNLIYRYPLDHKLVLRQMNITLNKNERVLLEGPSGGGKSTLAMVMVGLRKQETGDLKLHGTSVAQLGMQEWRRRIVASPQFGENYVLSDTLAFNLLMGRRWPPTMEDLEEAETICKELGLGPLLEKMPSGIQQVVGENGWRLSHGEKSRIYIARVLLEGADLVILDEGFGSLDPETLKIALDCVMKRAPALMVIAHP